MADDRDPLLESLFLEASHEMEGKEFTALAIAAPQRLKQKLLAAGFGIMCLIALCAWLLALPMQEFALLSVNLLSTNLVDLGETQTAWLLSPVNNLASILILSIKLCRSIWKRITASNYAY